MSTYKKILVPVDFSDVSAKALVTALELALELDAKVEVLHAVPMTTVAMPIEGQPVYNEDLIEEMLAEGREELHEFLKIQLGEDPKVGENICFGEPTTEVNIFAETHDINLIVMGTHGRSGLKHLLMGSVAESVLRHSNIPVLTVPVR